MKRKILSLLLFLISILLAGCPATSLIRPQLSIVHCNYCVTGWRWVCTHNDPSGICCFGHYECDIWETRECDPYEPIDSYSPPPLPFQPIPTQLADDCTRIGGPIDTTPILLMSEEVVLDRIFGEERKPLTLEEFRYKIGGFTEKDIIDYAKNGNRLTGRQLLRIADRLDTTVGVIENIYEYGIVVEQNK